MHTSVLHIPMMIVQDENGKSKDYSFVHFEIEEADKAIEKANGSF